MPRLWVSDRLQKRAEGRGGEAGFRFNFPFPGIQSAAGLLAPRRGGKGRTPRSLPSPLRFPFTNGQQTGSPVGRGGGGEANCLVSFPSLLDGSPSDMAPAAVLESSSPCFAVSSLVTLNRTHQNPRTSALDRTKCTLVSPYLCFSCLTSQ